MMGDFALDEGGDNKMDKVFILKAHLLMVSKLIGN